MTHDHSTAAVDAVPLMPHLVCRGAAAAIDFYGRAFGATEEMRLAGDDGRIMNACVRINGALVMLVDENLDWGVRSPESLGGSPVTIHLNVADVDAVADRAAGAGADVVTPVADQFWGDRYGVLRDPFGHLWSVATPVRRMTMSEIGEAAREAAPMA